MIYGLYNTLFITNMEVIALAQPWSRYGSENTVREETAGLV
jgi:hypothetical protein